MSVDFDLIPGDSRSTAYPISRPDIWKFYEDARAIFWVPGEIDFSKDRVSYVNASPAIQTAIKTIIGWFASSDGRVTTNLTERFIKEIPIYEAIRFFNFQAAIEDIHAETYSKNIEDIIPDKKSRDQLFDALDTIPIIKKMNTYADSTTASSDRLVVRLLKFACLEGIWFTGCFSFIDWLGAQNICPGLVHANELISRDEGLHTAFGLHMVTLIKPERQLIVEEAHYYVNEAVLIGIEFINEMLPKRELPGMNSEMMTEHIKSKADDMLLSIRHKVIYNIPSPFKDAELKRSTVGKTSFFEKRPGTYSKPIEDNKNVEEDYDV